MAITFVILAVTIAMFVWGRFSLDVVAVGSLLTLFLTGIIDLDQALSGFSNSTVILIGTLFVVGEGLTRTGITAWVGDRLIGASRGSAVRLLVLSMTAAAVMSAVVSNTATVAAFMPAVVLAAWGVRSTPSAFLIPLAFASSVGGLLTLTGTAPNIVITEALDIAETTGEYYWDAELHRLKGEFLLSQTKKPAKSEDCFHRSIEIAHRQSAKSLELRAAMSLGRLWQNQGKKDKARELLNGVYGWFTEGFDTPDLIDAKALLEELS